MTFIHWLVLGFVVVAVIAIVIKALMEKLIESLTDWEE